MALPPPRQLGLQLVSAAAWAWAFATAAQAQAQTTTAEAAPDNSPGGGAGIKVSFRPSVAIVVGIFTMIFSLTFLLLMYAKFCHPSSSPAPATGGDSNSSNAALPHQEQAQGGGVPKAVIESLPFFRFATLRGSRQGMECSVCLARFDDADLLRLLPRCRHAFHLACVDRWLDSNASCPLCRTRVDDADAALGLKYPSSARIVFGGDADDAALSSSSRFDDTAAGRTGSGRDLLDIFVERVPGPGAAAAQSPAELDRHRHHIIVSDLVFKSRWSELNSAALLALDAEMMMVRGGGSTSSASGGRGIFFPPDDDYYSPTADDPADLCSNEEASSNLAAAEEKTTRRRDTERKRLLLGASTGGGSGSPAARTISSASGVLRSMSEIVSLPRLRAPARERLSSEENRYQQRWLPIAQRTARWFAGRSRARGEAAGEDGGGEQAPRQAAHGGGACDV
ncbi:hypothetical protein U9M48_045075 [Paspalum notatum var. saurae]|uniref:RING-type E3 ubiquitin transferase n=1 Tax=Paspalum notatum var. saurae TaxID=547442 RepID=A0AAQ3V278_PASNO